MFGISLASTGFLFPGIARQCYSGLKYYRHPFQAVPILLDGLLIVSGDLQCSRQIGCGPQYPPGDLRAIV